MYATQTYLGFTLGRAKIYLYAITEDYRDERSRLLAEVFRTRISEFGLSTGENIAVVLPHEGYEDQTRQQIETATDCNMQKFYQKNISGRTPGLLLSQIPVDRPAAWRGAFYIPFDGVKHPFRESKKLIEELKKIEKDNTEENRFVELLMKTNDFTILQPTIFGVGLNLNSIFSAILNRYR